MRKLRAGEEEKLEVFLSKYAQTSMFLRSNCEAVGLEYKDERYHGEYLASFDKSENVQGVLAHYWNGNVIVQAPDDNVLHQLINAFKNRVSRPVAGVLGPGKQGKIVIKSLGLSQKAFAVEHNEALYALDLDKLNVPDSLNREHCQIIEVGEIGRNVLKQWIRAYQIEALGAEDNKELDLIVENRVERTISEKSCWGLLIDGVPVSLSGFNSRLPDMVQIGPVWTPPEYRSLGYARTVVALTLEKAKEEGVKKAILFTNDPAAIKAYEAIGFEKIGHYCLALLKQPCKIQ